MGKGLFSLIRILARIVGSLSAIAISKKISFLFYIFKRELITSQYKKKFKSFGDYSLLSFDVSVSCAQRISIGRETSIMRHSILEVFPERNDTELIIGDLVSIGEFSHITCSNKIVIGDGVLTGRFVLITDNGHGRSSMDEFGIPPLRRKLYSSGYVVIGNNVWIGDKVTILPNVTIGEGAIVGANAVVSKNVPPYAVVGGNPARILKMIKIEP